VILVSVELDSAFKLLRLGTNEAELYRLDKLSQCCFICYNKQTVYQN